MAEDPITARIRDLDTSFIMTSGAGCGKTYRMVERYTAIVEQDASTDVTRIIAVTFTEKAAAQLRDRVRERCREMMAETAGEERERWQRAARRLATAPVSTIHGLCSRLLRENSVAANVDPRFRTLDETEQQFLLRDCVRETLLERVHAGGESARRVVAFWGLESAGAHIRGMIGNREELGALLREPPSAAELLERWQAAAEQGRLAGLEAALADERWAAVREVLGRIAPVPGDTAGDRQQAFREAAGVAMSPDAGVDERIQALSEALGQGNRRAGAKAKWQGREDELEQVKAALSTLADLKDDYSKRISALAEVEGPESAELAAALCAEASAAADRYAAEKRRRSALDFADLQIMARDLLVGHPEVLERVRSRYDYVLVDEFQDTNELQKEIIWLIAGGDASAGRPPAHGRVFVVGDAKQSIYGFRNADVTVINRTLREFREADGCDVLRLDTSWRSHPSLIRFHNDLFAHDCVMGETAEADYQARYEPVGAVRETLELPHDVELMLISAGGGAAGDEEEAAESLNAREARMLEAESLAARIREIVDTAEVTVEIRHEDGTTERRGAHYGDFAMLFQSMTSVGIYEYALRREGVPFYTVAGRGFYNRQEIRDCLNLLSVLENAADELSLVGALRSPMFALSDDTIFWLTRGELPLVEAMRQAAEGRFEHQRHLPDEQVARVRRAHDVIGRLRACKDRLSLSELVERMLSETGAAAVHLSQFAGRQAAANLQKLTDLARSFEQGSEFGLRQFIAYLRDLVVTEHREGLASVHEEAADVVQLLTVHKAKGLEWPIVVIPDMGWSGGGRGGGLAVSRETGPVPQVELPDGGREWGTVASALRDRDAAREEAERRRLLYVALTRARDHLILSGSFRLKRSGDLSSGPWLQWVCEALEVHPPEVEDGDAIAPEGEWRCLLSRPDRPQGPGGAARIPPRAELDAIDEALAAAGAGEALPAQARPISPAEHFPARVAVTSLEHYRTCPRLFYLRHVARLPERRGPREWLRGLSGAERGTMAHRALEIIGRDGLSRPEVLDEAIDLAAFPGGVASRLADDERERLREAIDWFLREAALPGEEGRRVYRDWVAGAERLRSEVQFAAPLAGAIIEGTIDVLAQGAGGETRVLDYKTGQDASAATLESYRFQVGLYCAAVEAITGRLPADAALVLLDARRVEELRPEIEAQRALRRASDVIEAVRRGEFDRPEQCPAPQCALAYACQLT